MTKKKKERLRDYQRRYRELTERLVDIGFLWQGTITNQMVTCGTKTCACHRDTLRRHGPYPNWTTKIKGRTIARRLTAQEADLYEGWIENRRKFEKIRREMFMISQKIAPLLIELRIERDPSLAPPDTRTQPTRPGRSAAH